MACPVETSVNPYVTAGKLKTFEGGTELVPGIKASADAAKNGDLVASSHLAFPSLGQVRESAGQSFTLVPLNYSSLK